MARKCRWTRYEEIILGDQKVLGKITSMPLLALGITSLQWPFSSSIPFGNPGVPHQGTHGWDLSAPFRQSTKGAQRPLGAIVTVAAAGAGRSPRRGRGRDGGTEWGGAERGPEFRPLFPPSPGATPGRRFCAMGWILDIAYKSAVSEAGSAV